MRKESLVYGMERRKIENRYIESLDALNQALEVEAFIKTLPFWKNEMTTASMYFTQTAWEPRYSAINLTCRDVDYEMLIELVVGPIHRKFGCDWQLIVHASDMLYLKTQLEHCQIHVNLYEGEMKSCLIVRRAKARPYTEADLENYFTDIKYEMVCNG